MIRARATTVSASMPFGALVHLLPAGRAEPRGSRRPVSRDRRGATAPRRPAGRSSTISSTWTQRRWGCWRSCWTVARCSSSGRYAVRPPRLRPWRHCGGVMTWCGSTSATSAATTSTPCSTSFSAVRFIRTRWPRSGRPVGGTPCSSVSWCSARKDAGDLAVRRGVWWLRGSLSSTPRLTDVVDDRVRAVSDEARGRARAPGGVGTAGTRPSWSQWWVPARSRSWTGPGCWTSGWTAGASRCASSTHCMAR